MKSSFQDLAIFGGEPSFEEELHVGCPNIGNRQHLLERITDMLERKWLTNIGPFVKEFESRISELIGVKHCIAMCNGTVALEIAIRALGLNGEVILPAFTFVATAHALKWQEITPVFCDIDPVTHNIDPLKVEGMITPRTSGIIGVHLWGRPCDIEALSQISRRHNLRLLFDAAHAFGCSYRGQMLGGFGDAEVFSFHATKIMNSFEGGAVVTNNDDLASEVRLMRNFGFTFYDRVDYIGINGKMTEVCAAMGLTSLESMDNFVNANYLNYKEYQQNLKDIPGIKLIDHDDIEKSVYHYIVLEINPVVTILTRDQLVDILFAENILARRYFYPGCHRMEPYRSFFPHAGLLLPETERLVTQVLILPTGTTVSTEDVTRICGIIRLALQNATEVKMRLEATKRISASSDKRSL
jgi:dTDP-4-amino-4,6-dideoxygalactose transaminase